VARALVVEPALGGRAKPVRIVACAAGSAGSLYRAAAGAGATFYVTGEMRHHDALAAAALGLTCLCLGHAASERPVLPVLARAVRGLAPGLQVVVSRADAEPLRFA
jgi:putative NIF3 family GTP cyclohydrolase 1 type 2